jgi:hypothetical protein
MSINFMKGHQPNLPHPDFIHKSMSKSKYADSLVENDTRIGRILDKVRALGLDKGNMLVFWTTDNGAWQDVYPDAGYTPFRGTAARVGNYKWVFNLRGDDGAQTGGLAVDSNLGWKGQSKYVGAVPQVFDLRQDPQERYDIFMNKFTERTWVMVTIGDAIKGLMKTYVQYPPRKLRSEFYGGPITLTDYERFQHIRAGLQKQGISIPLPSGN